MGKTKSLWALAALSCFLIAENASAQEGIEWPGHFPPRKYYFGLRFDFGAHTYYAQMQLAPWYSYFPYEAYFNAPPPLGIQYPNWPSPFPPAPIIAPPPEKTGAAGSPIRGAPTHRVGYPHYRYQSPPAYWYGQ